MSTEAIPTGSIVVGVDGSPAGEHAVLWAAEEARLERRGLTLVHASRAVSATDLAWYSKAGIPPRRVTDRIQREADQVVDRARSLAADVLPAASIDAVVAAGDPRNLLLDLGRDAALTVVGTRGHGRVAHLLLGSVSSALVRHSQGPVVVVRPCPEDGRGVLVGADGSEESVPLVEQAFREASLHRLPLTVVHCLWDGLLAQVRWTPVPNDDPVAREARLRVSESVAGMSEFFPDVPMNVIIARGAVDACLADLSSRYDLLLVGRPERPLLARLTLSGLTLPVVEHAHTPVLVVP